MNVKLKGWSEIVSFVQEELEKRYPEDDPKYSDIEETNSSFNSMIFKLFFLANRDQSARLCIAFPIHAQLYVDYTYKKKGIIQH